MKPVFTPTNQSVRLQQRLRDNPPNDKPSDPFTREQALELAKANTFDLQFFNGSIATQVAGILSLMQEFKLTDAEVGFDPAKVEAQQLSGYRWEANHRLTLARKHPSQAARGRFLGEDTFEKLLAGPATLGHPALTHADLGTTPEEIAALRARSEPRPT